jgi:hypothetical protein
MASELSESDLGDILSFLRASFSTHLRVEQEQGDAQAPATSKIFSMIQSLRVLERRNILKPFLSKAIRRLGSIWPFQSLPEMLQLNISVPVSPDTAVISPGDCFFAFDLCVVIALWETDTLACQDQARTILSQCLSTAHGAESVRFAYPNSLLSPPFYFVSLTRPTRSLTPPQRMLASDRQVVQLCFASVSM